MEAPVRRAAWAIADDDDNDDVLLGITSGADGEWMAAPVHGGRGKAGSTAPDLDEEAVGAVEQPAPPKSPRLLRLVSFDKMDSFRV